MKYVLGVIGIAVLFIFSLLYLVWAYAVILQQTWQWFIVPTFGLKPLSFIQAFAINMILSVVSSDRFAKPKEEDENPLQRYLWLLVKPWILLVMFWFLHWIFLT